MSVPAERDKGTAAHAVLSQCLQAVYQWGLPMRASDHHEAVYPVDNGEPHESLSPSGAKQWMYCPASPGMQAEHPEPASLEKVRQVPVDVEYVNAVQVCLDYVAMRVKELEEHGYAVVVVTELKVHPGDFFGGDKRFDGTLDIGLLAYENGVLRYVEIVDFKAGAAVQIEPEDPQLDQYLLGLLARFCYGEPGKPVPEHARELTVLRARLTVVQPRNFRHTEKIRWRNIPELFQWMDNHNARVIEARRRIDETPEVFAPSPEACYGCSAKGVCKASYSYALDKAGILPEGAVLPEGATQMYDLLREGAVRDTRALSGEQLRAVLDVREMLKGALQAAEGWALDQMMKGVAPAPVVEFYMMVRGRSSRKWKEDEETTLKRLRRIRVQGHDEEKMHPLGKKELTETRLKSAPKVEEVLKAYAIPKDDARWAAFQALIEKPEGALTLAPRSDPRPEVPPLRKSPDEIFADPPAEGGAPPAKTEAE